MGNILQGLSSYIKEKLQNEQSTDTNKSQGFSRVDVYPDENGNYSTLGEPQEEGSVPFKVNKDGSIPYLYNNATGKFSRPYDLKTNNIETPATQKETYSDQSPIQMNGPKLMKRKSVIKQNYDDGSALDRAEKNYGNEKMTLEDAKKVISDFIDWSKDKI